MAGRKPLPTKLKLLKGTAQPCRLNKHEAAPDPDIPSAPRHLSREALMEWGRVTDELHRLGLLSSIDRAALAAYCQAYGRWSEAEAQIYADPDSPLLTTTTANGTTIQHPLVGVANTAAVLMHKFLTEFGMTPSSRSKVTATKREPEKKGFAAL
jgi:P27 family predicted phage terminase small subunit